MRVLAGLVLGLTAWMCAGTALALDPPGSELVRKVRKSVIRVANVSIESPVPFSGGAGGGSGVVFQIDYDSGTAYALTNHHVSGRALVNSVRFWDGAEYRAELVATEPGIDAALLRIFNIPDERHLSNSEKSIVAAPLGDSDKTLMGEWALVMGAPGAPEGINSDRDDPWQDYLLQQSATMRVVKGKDYDPRRYVVLWSGWQDRQGRQIMTNTPWSFVVQSAVNGGNSGGPLFNARGEVIGLNHATYRANDGQVTQNEHYTIPINPVKNFVYQILNTGKYELPWIGMDILLPQQFKTGRQVNSFMDKHLKLDEIRVWGVRKSSSAERAGLREGDVIIEFDGQSFPTIGDLRRYIFTLPIGKQVPVTVMRGSKKVDLVAEVIPKRNYDSELSL